MAVSKRIVLHFPKRVVERPIVCRLAKDYDLEFNILKALVTPEEEGLLVLELSGEQKEYDKGIRYLTETGVRIQSLSQNVIPTRKDAPIAVPASLFAPPVPLSLTSYLGGSTFIMKNALPVDYASRLAPHGLWRCISSPCMSLEPTVTGLKIKT